MDYIETASVHPGYRFKFCTRKKAIEYLFYINYIAKQSTIPIYPIFYADRTMDRLL